MIKLNEGLRKHDLIDLVLPIVSIDEYESKIDPDAIVVGFYVDDKDPAKDLSMFVESGAGDIIDTEVSPSQDDKGNYLVFVEFLRNEKFPENLQYVLETVHSITGIDDWSYTYYGGEDNKIPFGTESITENVRLEKKAPSTDEEQFESAEFFKESLLDNVAVEGKLLLLKKKNHVKIFEKVAIGEEELMIELLNLAAKPFSMDSKSLRECNAMRKMLGDNWDVNKIDEHYILTNDKDTKIMVIK